MQIDIIPLSKEYLEHTCTLVDHCFPHEPVPTDLTIRESMDKSRRIRTMILQEYGESIDAIDYWIAIDVDRRRVVGTTGLYEDTHDEREAAWLEWYCVDPAYRGHGIGELLLEKAIYEATKRHKKFLRLYTLEEPSPTPAHQLYERHGFTVFKRTWDEERAAYMLYLEKVL